MEINVEKTRVMKIISKQPSPLNIMISEKTDEPYEIFEPSGEHDNKWCRMYQCN